jgi:hypothetical protein
LCPSNHGRAISAVSASNRARSGELGINLTDDTRAGPQPLTEGRWRAGDDRSTAAGRAATATQAGTATFHVPAQQARAADADADEHARGPGAVVRPSRRSLQEFPGTDPSVRPSRRVPQDVRPPQDPRGPGPAVRPARRALPGFRGTDPSVRQGSRPAQEVRPPQDPRGDPAVRPARRALQGFRGTDPSVRQGSRPPQDLRPPQHPREPGPAVRPARRPPQEFRGTDPAVRQGSRPPQDLRPSQDPRGPGPAVRPARRMPQEFRGPSQAMRVTQSPPLQDLPAPGPATRPAERQPRQRQSHRSWRSVPWLLILALIVQGVLSARLLGSNTAFTDESTYLHAGRIELLSLFHNEGNPWYQTYFSGAPVLYPIIAAAANGIGGLVAARAVSLIFMLGATVFLYASAKEIFGKLAAFLAIAVYIALGPTQFLGAFATYDAMSLMLMAAATWCVIRSARVRREARWLLIAAALLALANATKYASAIWDPIVVGLAFVTATDKKIVRAATLALDTLIILGIGLAVGGPAYVKGIMWTTLARGYGTDAPLSVLEHAWDWVGAILVMAAISTIIALILPSRRKYAALCAILTIAVVLAPANQARIHTLTSLQKHVDFGAWFGAIAVGYGLSQLVAWTRRGSVRITVSALITGIVALPMGYVGVRQADYLYHSWPNSKPLISELTKLMTPGRSRHYLVEDYNVPMYYLQGSVPWQEWNSTWYLSYRGRTGTVAYKEAIKAGYFALIVLDFNATKSLDATIVQAIHLNPSYQLVDVIRTSNAFGSGNYTIWKYEPGGAPRGG